MRETAFVCKDWSGCVGHPPTPTAGNFEIAESWNHLVNCQKSTMAGFGGMDWTTLREVTGMLGIECNQDFYRRMKFIEDKIFEKYSEES